MRGLYTVTIKNRYASLCPENESVTEKYVHLIQANEQTFKELLPAKKKSKKKPIFGDSRVINAREKTKKATRRNREKLQRCKSSLQKAHGTILEEKLVKLIVKVQSTDAISKYTESWKLINQITRRKSAKQAIIKANSKEDHIKKWVANKLGKITPVIENLETSNSRNLSLFTSDEYSEVKKSLIKGKALRSDEFAPEVLKYCDLDDIILSYVSKLLVSEKPDQ